MDLVIRNGTVVTAAGRAHADVGVEGGHVAHAPEMHSASDFDLLEGQTVTGRPVLTLSPGEVVFDSSSASEDAGRGRRVPRIPFARL